jgi:outer membrane protein, heavy metal efflux system
MKVQGFFALFVAIAAFYSPAAVRAGDMVDTSTSLSAFIDQALKVNPGLQAARSQARSAEARIPQAGAWEDPQAGVEFFATPITSANPFKDGMETDYFIQQMIPLSSKKGLMSDAASASARMAEQSAFASERNLLADVKKAYAMIFSAQRRIDVNTENQRLLAQIVESARVKYSVGLVTQGDVLKAQVELAKLQNDRADLERELVNATSMMNTLRSVPVPTPIGRVADVPLAKVSDSFENLQARALENRPELRGMTYELEMNKAELAASERERLPDLMVRGMYKQMKEGTDQWAAMLSINIPFAPWASGKYSGKIEENSLAARATEQSLTEMRNMIQAEVREKWAKISSQWQQIERFRQVILPQTEQSLQSTLAAYETNQADFLSLIDSYRMVQMLRMDYYMLVGEYLANVALLERAIGGDLG